MKKFAFILAIVAASLVAHAGKKAPSSDALVCHGAIGSYGRVMEVTPNRLDSHLAHGDYQLPDDFISPDGRCPGLGN
jgi:hypothetical protein